MKFLKGQLHLHTSISDGTWPPQQIADLYKELGYDFMVVTDHNINYNPYKYIKKDNNFLVLPGMETNTGANSRQLNKLSCIHLNGLCFQNEFTPPKNDMNNIGESINVFIEELYKANALPQVNHPNWNWPNPYAFDYKELLSVRYPYILEVKNCCAFNHSEGNAAWESTEFTWDTLLTAGKKVLASFTDDAHHYAVEVRNRGEEYHIPGNASVMVNSELNPASIKNAISMGDFYCSKGVELEEYHFDSKKIYIKIKKSNKNKTDENTDLKYTVIFKGRMGRPLYWFTDTEGEYKFSGINDEEYVRVKIITNNYDCALTQPVFQDGSKIILTDKL